MLVVELTDPTVNRTQVTLRELNGTVTAAPLFVNDPTETEDPSENVNVPAVI